MCELCRVFGILGRLVLDFMRKRNLERKIRPKLEGKDGWDLGLEMRLRLRL